MRLRLPTLRFLRLALRLRARRLDTGIESLLVIAPHPDDETLGCGGLLLSRRGLGAADRIVFLTDGAASHRGHPTLSPETLAHTRRTEAINAAALLGVDATRLSFLDLPDGELPRLALAKRETVIHAIASIVRAIAPSAVLLPSRHDGSSEHFAAYEIVAAALDLCAVPTRRLEYLVWAAYSPRLLARVLCSPSRIYRHPFPGLGPAKARAIAAHASQFQPTPPWAAAVQSVDFAKAFSPEDEFFLESSP